MENIGCQWMLWRQLHTRVMRWITDPPMFNATAAGRFQPKASNRGTTTKVKANPVTDCTRLPT